MKNIINRITDRQTVMLVLLAVLLICSGQGTSDAFFGDLIEAFVDIFGILVDVIAGTAQIAAEVVGLSIRVVATIVWHTDSLWDLEPFPNGGLIGVVVSNFIHLWDPIIGRTTATLPHAAAVRDIAVSPDGLLLASGSADNTVRVWDPATGTLRGTLIGHTGAVLSVAFSPDGLLLASGSADNTVRLWNPATGTLRGTLTGHTADVLSVAFSPDGLLLASGSADNTVRLWDPTTGARQATLDHKSPVLSVAFSPDGNMLATGSQDGTARLWDPATEKVIATLGHESPVRRAVFSPDGDILYSTSADGKMRQWEITDETGTATNVPAGVNPVPAPAGVCRVGDVLAPGESCTYPGTEAVFSVLGNGKSRWNIPGFSFLDKTSIGGSIRFTGTINGKKYHFVADATPSNAWEIKEIGDTPVTTDDPLGGTPQQPQPSVDPLGDTPVTTDDQNRDTTQPPQQPVGTGVTPTLTSSTAAPLTEATLHEGVVTLTLSGGTFERSRIQIGNAVSVSGISGVKIGTFGPAWLGVRRVSDTRITVELGFEGNFNTDSTLTFTVGADAIKGYAGAALTTQISVTAVTESVVASAASPLTEATLDGGVVTLTLSGATYELSIFQIADALTVSGIPGVTIGTLGIVWFGVKRVSGTQITVELGFKGNFDTDSTLTFTVGADAIKGYNGPALTAEVSVTAIKGEALLANFPNPFNPETWIPYQLAKPAEVIITIYATNGHVVRQLALGHQTAGIYQSRSRAAYWDGRNQYGEPVASGLYFYTLTAGDFTATRKMLIRK